MEAKEAICRTQRHDVRRCSARQIRHSCFGPGGLSNREIAGALATAEGTVKNQVSSILSKLGVRDRTRAVLKAIQDHVV